jgi:hypothetical protein
LELDPQWKWNRPGILKKREYRVRVSSILHAQQKGSVWFYVTFGVEGAASIGLAVD